MSTSTQTRPLILVTTPARSIATSKSLPNSPLRNMSAYSQLAQSAILLTPPATPSRSSKSNRTPSPPLPRRSNGSKRTSTIKPPPSSLALHRIQNTPTDRFPTSSPGSTRSYSSSRRKDSSIPTIDAQTHYSDVFGATLDSPYTGRFETPGTPGSMAWYTDEEEDGEEDGFSLANSRDPFANRSPHSSTRPSIFQTPSSTSNSSYSASEESPASAWPLTPPARHRPGNPHSKVIGSGSWLASPRIYKREDEEERRVGRIETDLTRFEDLNIREEITPTNLHADIFLPPKMDSRSLSTTPTGKPARFPLSETLLGSNLASPDEKPSDQNGFDSHQGKGSLRANATASLKRMFRNTFQPHHHDPRQNRQQPEQGVRFITNNLPPPSPSRSNQSRSLKPGLSKLHGSFLFHLPSISPPRSTESEKRKEDVQIKRKSLLVNAPRTRSPFRPVYRRSVSTQKGLAAAQDGNRRVSRAGLVAKDRRLRRSTTETGVWFKSLPPPPSKSKHKLERSEESTIEFPSTALTPPRPRLARTDGSTIFPGSPASEALSSEMQRSKSPSPRRIRRVSVLDLRLQHRPSPGSNSSSSTSHSPATDTTEGDDSDWQESEESFSSSPMMSPREMPDLEINFSPLSSDFAHTEHHMVISPRAGESAWEYDESIMLSPASTKGSQGTSPTRERTALHFTMEKTGAVRSRSSLYPWGGLMQVLAGEDNQPREAQRKRALAKLEGMASGQTTPGSVDWEGMFEEAGELGKAS